MANLVNTGETYTTRKNLLIGQESYYLATNVIVKGSANTVIKAGQPLVGDLTDKAGKENAFTAGTSNAVGVNLHEVTLDADGYANATCVVKGCFDSKKLDAAMVTAIETAAIDGIVLMEGSAI